MVRVEATGVSFAEQQMRRGKYYDQPPFPFVPGYDLVGEVERAGRRRRPRDCVGQRVAALTKIGGWADRVRARRRRPGRRCPTASTPAAAETVVVNGITAWRMLHRSARVPPGQTIVVLGANGGVGSTLVQLARHAGIRVIGTAVARGTTTRVRELGAIPVDYRTEDVRRARARARARTAWTPSSTTSAARASSTRGGCSPAAARSSPTARRRPATTPATRACPVLKLLARLLPWNALPNGRRAHVLQPLGGRAQARPLPRRPAPRAARSLGA